jgi:aldose 1-epimerase
VNKLIVSMAFIAAATVFSLGQTLAAEASVSEKVWGKLPDGKAIKLFTLKNDKGIETTLSEFGGTVVTLKTADKNGVFADIVLGHNSLSPYIGRDQNPYFGSIIGRYGNRIAKGKFSVDGKTYTLATNNGANHLHGGVKGFDQRVWIGKSFRNADGVGVNFSYTSADGEEGYPGNLKIEVRYTLTNTDELHIDYEATTDKATPVNLTNHSYWNLSGNAVRPITGHKLMIKSDRMTPVDDGLIPTGELASVKGTPFDFNISTTIGERIDQENLQLKYGKGYDHNWVLAEQGRSMKLAAVLSDPESGRALEIRTVEPAIQFYSGNFLDGSVIGKSGKKYDQRYGLCLETQHYPDAPNQQSFPNTLLRPGQVYKTSTVHRFFIQ